MTTLQTLMTDKGIELYHDNKHVGNLETREGRWVPFIFGAITTHSFKTIEAAEYYALAIFIEKQYTDQFEELGN